MTEPSEMDHVTSFYAKLLSSQEPLGVEFEKVLYDNLWELYERCRVDDLIDEVGSENDEN